MAFKMKGFSGFKSKADIINQYASGIGDAMATFGSEEQEKWQKKKTAKKAAKKSPNEKNFPDLTGDGKVTQADILKGRGVFKMKGCSTCKSGKRKRKCTCSDNMTDGRSRSAAFQKYSCKKRG